MPTISIHKDGQVYRGEVKENTNLVVRAGIRQFPFPHLRYRCGMGKCGTCTSRIIAGAEHLPPPNWKEERVLGGGWRLASRLCGRFGLNHAGEPPQKNLVPGPAPPAGAASG